MSNQEHFFVGKKPGPPITKTPPSILITTKSNIAKRLWNLVKAPFTYLIKGKLEL